MARGKKKETLTPEERLQAALVPEGEQPYPVPGNWCWTYIKFGFDVTSSKRVHKEDWLSQGIPFYRTRELVKLSENGCVDNELFISEKLYNSFVAEYGVPQKGDLLISGVGTIGVPYVINENQKFYFKDGNIIWFKNRGLFHPKYVYFLYKSTFIDNQIHQMSSGTTVDTYTIINANATVVPLPPFSEQQRIIDRIESLFAKLDEAKQKAQDALDSFETRKAAILHRAFTGELTAQWRKEHGVGMESWKEETLESVCYSIFDGDHMPPPKSEQGIPFLVISNVNTGHLSFENTRFVPESYYEALSDTRKPEYGDVLYTLVGSYGIPVIVDREHPFCFQRHMALLKPKNIDSYYLWYILQSREMFEKATQIATGTAQLTVPIKGLRQLKFNCASANEQGEIVRILDDLLAKEQQAKETAEGVLEQIDLIKKAILARAFRGELGTNDPSEESAVELLKQVL